MTRITVEPPFIEDGKWHPQTGTQLLYFEPERCLDHCRMQLSAGQELQALEISAPYDFVGSLGAERAIWRSSQQGRMLNARDHEGRIVAAIATSEDGTVLDFAFLRPPLQSDTVLPIELRGQNQQTYLHFIHTGQTTDEEHETPSAVQHRPFWPTSNIGRGEAAMVEADPFPLAAGNQQAPDNSALPSSARTFSSKPPEREYIPQRYRLVDSAEFVDPIDWALADMQYSSSEQLQRLTAPSEASFAL